MQRPHAHIAQPTAPLSLELELARAENAGDPYGFRFAPQEYLLRRAGGGFESTRFNWDDSLQADLQALRSRRDPVLMQRIGERLRELVAPLPWAEHEAKILQASREGRRIILTVRSAAAELYALPWELLTLKASAQHVGALPGVLLRYEWPETSTAREHKLPRTGAGRILVAWSAAGGAVPADAHLDAIQRACSAGFCEFDPRRDTVENTSLSRLAASLSSAQKDGQPISVLHLLCHGSAVSSTFGLRLDGDGSGEAVTVDAGRLRQVLAPYVGMVRLIVLAVCDGGNSGRPGNQLGSVAQALHQAGCASVIASRFPLSMPGSICLTAALYDGLLVGPDSLESAILSARQKLALDAEQNDWASIQLYARESDGDDTRPIVFRPYQGLASFGRAERRFFFGRDALIDKLWQRVRELSKSAGATRLLAVLGPSGSGKSSVACAGLLSAIEQRPIFDLHALRVAVFRPGEHPMRTLAAALRAMPEGSADWHVLILVDQLEEIYAQCSDKEERDFFVSLLLSAARDASRKVTVVVTMRSDFLGETLGQHLELNRVIAEQCVVVGGMNSDELRQAVGEPARRAGRPLDDATIELLLAQTAGSDGALPLLEVALSQIWEGMLADVAPEATLREIGGVGGALANKAQEIYQALTSTQKATARRAFLRLIKLGDGTRDTRRRATIRELCGPGETEADLLFVVRKFAGEQARLLTLSGDGAEAVAEVTHEALFDYWQELRRWIEDGRAARRLLERAAEAAKLWHDDKRPAGRLWRPPDLTLLSNYQRLQPEQLNALELAFLDASSRQLRTERMSRVGTALVILLAIVTAVFIYFRKERERLSEARAAAEKSRQQFLNTFVDRGREALLKGTPLEALIWLQQASEKGATHPSLPYLLADAARPLASMLAVFRTDEEDGQLESAIFSPDGARIAAIDGSTARVWDAGTFNQLFELPIHQGPVTHIAFSSDGLRLVTSSGDNTARVWDARSGQIIHVLGGHEDTVRQAVFRPDGRAIATIADDKTLRLWDAATGTQIRVLRSKDREPEAVQWTRSGRQLITKNADASISIWNAETGHLDVTQDTLRNIESVELQINRQQTWIVTLYENGTASVDNLDRKKPVLLRNTDARITKIIISDDGKWAITAHRDPMVRIWNLADGSLAAILRGHSKEINDLQLSSDDGRLATASADGTIRLWDMQEHVLLTVLHGHDSDVTSVAFSSDGHRLLTTSDDGTARVWDADWRPWIRQLPTPKEFTRSAALSPDGRRLIFTQYRYPPHVLDVGTGQELFQLKGQEDKVASVEFTRDGQRIVSRDDQHIIRFWDASTGQAISVINGGKGPSSLTLDASGSRILCLSQRTVKLWNATNGQLISEVPVARHAALSPNGQFFVTTHDDHSASVWDAATGQKLVTFQGHGDAVTDAAWSADSQRIVTASADKTARIWEARTGHQIAVLFEHQAAVRSVAFSSDGTRIATAAATVGLLWDAQTARLVAQLADSSSEIGRVHFSPDGQRVVTEPERSSARLWNARNGELITALSRDDSRTRSAIDTQSGEWDDNAMSSLGQLGAIGRGFSSNVAFSSDGRLLLVLSAERPQLWDAQSGQPLRVFAGDNPIFSVDSRRLLTMRYGAVWIWDISPETRSSQSLSQLIRCLVPYRFEAGSVVPTVPDFSTCAGVARRR